MLHRVRVAVHDQRVLPSVDLQTKVLRNQRARGIEEIQDRLIVHCHQSLPLSQECASLLRMEAFHMTVSVKPTVPQPLFLIFRAPRLYFTQFVL